MTLFRDTSMKLAYIGNFGPYFSTESTWGRAFERLGHDVLRIQQEDAKNRPDEAMVAILTHMKGELAGVGSVFYSRTHNNTALGAGWTQRWRMLEDVGIKTCALHLDLFFGLERERERLVEDHDPLFTMGLVCTPDGGNQERFEACGVNHRWMRPAIDAECAYVGEPFDYLCDIMFVGSRGYHPEYPQRPQLIDTAHARWGDRFVHVGPDGRGVARGHDLNRAIACAKVILGDSCLALRPDRHTPRYWSDRIPETLGRGGLLVHPAVEGLAGMSDVVLSAEPTIESVLDRVDEVLAWSPRERAMQRLEAKAATSLYDTYDVRAEQVLEWLDVRHSFP